MSNYFWTDSSIKTLWEKIKSSFYKKEEGDSLQSTINNHTNTINQINTQVNTNAKNINLLNSRIEQNYNILESKISHINDIVPEIYTLNNIDENTIGAYTIQFAEDLTNYNENNFNMYYLDLTSSANIFEIVSDSDTYNETSLYFYQEPKTNNDLYPITQRLNEMLLAYFVMNYDEVYQTTPTDSIPKLVPNDSNVEDNYDGSYNYYIKSVKGIYHPLEITSDTMLKNQLAQRTVYKIAAPSYTRNNSYYYDMFKLYYLVSEKYVTNEGLLSFVTENNYLINRVLNLTPDHNYTNFGSTTTTAPSVTKIDPTIQTDLMINLGQYLLNQAQKNVLIYVKNGTQNWICTNWETHTLDGNNYYIFAFHSIYSDFATVSKTQTVISTLFSRIDLHQKYIIVLFDQSENTTYFKTINSI